MSEPLPENFMRLVRRDPNGCLTWCGVVSKTGYPQYSPSHAKTYRAHRFAYERVIGPIPEKMTIDHLCRNRSCVNVDHMEVVSNRENVLRGTGPSAINHNKTHCNNGHPLSGPNLGSGIVRGRPTRLCRACSREHSRRWLEKYKREHGHSYVAPARKAAV